LSYAELKEALEQNEIHLKRKHFKALVRFVDGDLNGSVNMEENVYTYRQTYTDIDIHTHTLISLMLILA
jgi:hypothetical protein